MPSPKNKNRYRNRPLFFKKKRKGTLGISLFILALLILFVLPITAYISLQNYLRSDAFRQMIEGKLSTYLAGEAHISPFHWSGTSISSESIEATGSKLKKLKAREIETSLDLGGIKKRTWQLKNSRIEQLHLEIGGDTPPPPPSKESPTPQKKKQSFLTNLLPNKLSYQNLEIIELSGLYQTSKNTISWENSSATIVPNKAGEGVKITCHGGEIKGKIDPFKKIKLKTAELRRNKNLINLIKSSWKVDGGTLSLWGEYIPKTKQGVLEGELEKLPVEKFLSETWKRRLTGELEIDFHSITEKNGLHTQGKLTLKDGVITALPVLDRLAAYADTARLRRIPLDEARLNFSYKNERLTLRDIVLAKSSLIRLEGDLEIENRNLAGNFRLGFEPGILANIPGAEEKVFSPGERGMLWAPFLVWGTLDNPEEDLSKRIIAAARERMFETLAESGTLALKHSVGALDKGTQLLAKNEGLISETGQLVVEKLQDLQGHGSQAIDEVIRQVQNPSLKEAPESIKNTLKEGTDVAQDLINGILGGSQE